MRVEQREIFTKKVRAGSRSYFFDVKKNNDDTLYLTITENKFQNENTKPEKFRILIYEDKLKDFVAGFEETIGFMKTQVSDI